MAVEYDGTVAEADGEVRQGRGESDGRDRVRAGATLDFGGA